MNKNEGFSLLGLVIFMIVVGIALPPLLLIAYNAVNNAVANEILFNVTSLGTEQMEIIKTKSFGNIVSTGSQPFSSPFTKYSYSITVNYVSPPNYDISVDPQQTNYKRVQINVGNSILPDIQTDLITIIANLDS